MFLEILLALFFGVVIGTATGLVPGLHPNSVLVLFFSISSIFVGIPVEFVLVFVVSLSVTNTFTDMIPSIFFGAPSDDNTLSVLPGHSFLLQGRGYEALFLTVVGGLVVTVLTVITLPLLMILIPTIYPLVSPHIHVILILFMVWIILSEKGVKKAHSLLIFLLAGIFGFITLNTLPSTTSVFAGLTGLFGISGIIVSYTTTSFIPKQRMYSNIKIRKKGILAGWIAGAISSLLPGLGPAQSGALASRPLRSSKEDFLVSLGGINTANIIFTFIVLATLDKTRSGATWFISQIMTITYNEMLLVAVVVFFSACLSSVVTLKIGKFFAKKIGEFGYKKINISVLAFLIILLFYFSGFVGLFVAFVGMFIGLLAISLGINRSQLMAFLIFPTIMFFTGTSPFLMNFLF